MSNEKFTQGEWRAEITRVRFPNGKMMWAEGGDFDTLIANAHLIAAAPVMYRLLSGICGEKSARCCNYAPESCEVCSIRKVLKKARGE
jgi:hypothetical protein